MAKPKLALIPAAQGTKFYSVLPSDGTGDFDFTRGSVATRINAQGLIENVASGQSRLNYPLIDGVQKGCPHHILEPARTNIVQYSEDFSNAYWTKNFATITSNNAISPDGTLNASKLASSNSGLNSRIEYLPTVSNNTIYTSSILVKKGSLNFISLNLRDKTGVTRVAYYDINNGTVSSTINSPADAKIENYGNGWYRASVSANVLSGSTTVRAQFVLASADGNVDTSINSFIYIWGAQLEAGSYPTSYIPTSGQSGGVTRSAETANGSGDAATFNDSEGVLMAEISALANDSNIEAISINAGNADNRLALFKWNVSNRIQIRVNIAGNTPIDAGVSVSNIEDLNKISLKYKSGDYALWINGFEVYVNSLADTPIGLNNLSFDSNGSNGVPFKGKTKQLQYFDSALADTQLEQLTSWQSFTDMADAQLYTIE